MTALDLEHLVAFRSSLDQWEDVIALIKGAKVLALPSVREGFGLVALEAVACGTPIVTVDHPRNASKDLVQTDQVGLVVSPDQFTDALRRVLMEDGFQRSQIKTGQEEVTLGGWTDVAYATLAIYETATA